MISGRTNPDGQDRSRDPTKAHRFTSSQCKEWKHLDMESVDAMISCIGIDPSPKRSFLKPTAEKPNQRCLDPSLIQDLATRRLEHARLEPTFASAR